MPCAHEAPHRTFRDPAGSLEIRPDGVFRSIAPAYAAEVRRFLAHPLAQNFIAKGRLIASEVQPHDDSQPMQLRHPRVPFISYPWEWPPALWLAAADLTLGLATDLLREDWILKDATPLNVLFQGTRPVFVDVLSIEPADLSQPVWLPYGQFVRTFVLPMLAHGQLGWPLHAIMMRRDGYEPEDLYASLPWKKRLRQPARSAVTLPMLLAKFSSGKNSNVRPRKINDPHATRHILHSTFKSLRQQMHRTAPPLRSSAWSDYASTASHYTTSGHEAKRRFVAAALSASQPRHVLDVGCNTGTYSRLAAETGASVVSIDIDLQAVNRLAVSLANSTLDILPLCVDLAHPTPAAGWNNRESLSFLSRAEGHFDTVLMLAVLHHLLIGSQIPLNHIATLCCSLTTRNLILEWVPPSDPKFQQILRGRDALYAHITEAAFRQAFAQHFDIAQEETLENGRILFHLVRSVH